MTTFIETVLVFAVALALARGLQVVCRNKAIWCAVGITSFVAYLSMLAMPVQGAENIRWFEVFRWSLFGFPLLLLVLFSFSRDSK